ncbi:hypothetical protein D3C75_971160 [compost metagenome]
MVFGLWLSDGCRCSDVNFNVYPGSSGFIAIRVIGDCSVIRVACVMSFSSFNIEKRRDDYGAYRKEGSGDRSYRSCRRSISRSFA